MAEEPSTLEQLGMNGPDELVAGAILLSAVLGAIIALVVVAKQRISAKKKNAYDMVLTLSETDFVQCESVFLDLAKTNNWQPVLDPQDATEHGIKQQVERYLNHFEFLSVCIRQNIVDENVIKAVLGDKLVKRLTAALPLIIMIRNEESDPEFFEHFEYVADQWKANPKIQEHGVVRTILGEICKI
ncbi:MAG: DUF4760 domain-containing protein [Defluviicoccus sp.]|nr:DUF4760 domain-containing protein [Defluviicoccus sp.]